MEKPLRISTRCVEMNASTNRSSILKKPNIILILNDDMGYSDLGCYGGEVQTPNLDRLASAGLRYTQFYNTARCCPSRASLLTGLYPTQADVGHMMYDDGVDGYLGDLSQNAVTIAEALKPGGYRCYMSGKWHVTNKTDGTDTSSWPCQRGFDDFYGILGGAANYYQPLSLKRNNEPLTITEKDEGYFFTDAVSDEAVRQIRAHADGENADAPFFQYVAYTAPHWPLHAHEEDIAKYKGRFDAGWDKLREERLQRMVDMGLIKPEWKLSDRDPDVPRWEDAENQDWQAKRMEVYAAQIDRMDQGIGRILDTLKQTGQLENTLIIFLADNGGCAEEIVPSSGAFFGGRAATFKTVDGREVRFGNQPDIVPGPEDTYASYGVEWANVSNTPFRYYKHWVHEGGISTPFIVHWPAGIQNRDELRHQPAQLPDVMATFLEVAGVPYPREHAGNTLHPLEGISMVPTFSDEPPPRNVLCWEHEGNRAVRMGKWKLVRRYPGEWELYDIEADRSETRDLAADHADVVEDLAKQYQAWAEQTGVIPWENLLELRKAAQKGA